MIAPMLEFFFNPGRAMEAVVKKPRFGRVFLANAGIILAFSLLSTKYAFGRMQLPGQLQEKVEWLWGISLAAPVLMYLVKIVLIGASLVFISSFMRGNATFGQLSTVAALAYLPVNLFSFGLGVTLVVTGMTDAVDPTSFGVFLRGFSIDVQHHLAFLNLIDPFKVWAMILVGIGFSKATRVSLKKGIMAVAIIWLLILIIQYSYSH